jgi:hypothetical protein
LEKEKQKNTERICRIISNYVEENEIMRPDDFVVRSTLILQTNYTSFKI